MFKKNKDWCEPFLIYIQSFSVYWSKDYNGNAYMLCKAYYKYTVNGKDYFAERKIRVKRLTFNQFVEKSNPMPERVAHEKYEEYKLLSMQKYEPDSTTIIQYNLKKPRECKIVR